MRTKGVVRAAAVVVGIEGIALVALAAWQIIAITTGDTVSLVSALALVILTAVGAAAVLAFAIAIWRELSWGRSGGIVTQVLILAVALGAVTGTYGHPATGLVLAIPAIVALVLLVIAVRNAGRDVSGRDGRDAASG
ncbi:histidine kinase [Microbacterium pumilum]|uniref:Histidine kinase n=1 Tax=Microbacterium pumilum TaxID=344165 RepID=A0ABP5DUC6_9MICO